MQGLIVGMIDRMVNRRPVRELLNSCRFPLLGHQFRREESEGAMCRMIQSGLFGVLILSWGVTAAVAQQRLGYNPDVYWYPVAGSLGYVQVRDELKLTAEQMKNIKEIGDEYVEKFVRPLYESFVKVPLEEQQKKLAELKKPEQE